MTREEFRDDIQDWEDLINFCGDNDLEGSIEDIVRKDEIDDMIRNILDCSGWESVVNFLANICNTCGGYYRTDGYGNLEELYYGAFEDYKNIVEGDFDSMGGFDDDDDGDDCPLEI